MFDAKVLAENIKKYRKEKGFHQSEFAEKLEISPQSVSKWECGLSCPSIENLCEISEILDVTVDMLLSVPKSGERTMIAVDGGGTKTEFVLFSENGEILNRMILGGCNPNAVGLESSFNILKSGIDALLKLNCNVCGIFIGAAGFASANNGENIENQLKEIYPNIRIQCESDIFNVIACSSDPDNCIAVICGTGSVVYASKNGVVKRFGGKGYLLDYGGSGYHLGRDAISASIDAGDGIIKRSKISELVEKKLGSSAWENIHKIYAEDSSYIASFAPCVFEAYECGDKIAENILQKNASCLAELINVASENAGIQRNIIASGSVITQSEVYRNMVQSKLNGEVVLKINTYPPVYGACIRCCKLCEIDSRLMKENYK